MTVPRDPYAVLGITPDATTAEITTAYRARVRGLHPDTHQPGDPQMLADVLAAYQVLRDPERRATHDRQHQRHTPAPVRLTIRVRSTPAAEPDLRAGPVRRHHQQ
jgi:curved DNA-binding protein CbpA